MFPPINNNPSYRAPRDNAARCENGAKLFSEPFYSVPFRTNFYHVHNFTMKTCPKCSVQNEGDKKFCVSCGSSLVSELDQLLEVHGLSTLAETLKNNDLLTTEALKSLTEADLNELNLASYGDRVRFKKMLDSIKTDESAPGKKTDEPITPKNEAGDALRAVSLAEESKKLLRQAALQGLSRASQILASTQNSTADHAATPSVPEVDTEDDQALAQKINRCYLFMLWGWATYGILGLVAWFFAYRNSKTSKSEILRKHWLLQTKLSSVWFGTWFVGSIVSGIIDKPGFYQLFGLLMLLTWAWYMFGAWKGRKALKEGKPPL